MKKLLFIPLFFLTLLAGCKGGPGNTPDVPEQFDLNKINFDYEKFNGYEEYKGLELFKKVSYGKEHYLFYIENNIRHKDFKVLYNDEILGTVELVDYFSYQDLTKYIDLINKYFNLELNIEEPETFKDFTYEFEKLENKIHLIILPTININGIKGIDGSVGCEKFIESDEYPLYYSDDEKDIHIGFTFKDNLIKPNCDEVKGVYNFTNLTNKYNARYCVPLPFCNDKNLSFCQYRGAISSSERKKIIKDIIGLEYDDFYYLNRDYEVFKDFLEYNRDISNYEFYNSSFNEEYYNYIKNYGTTFNISFDKFCFKGIHEQSEEEYRYIGLIANINSVELYELDNEKYVSTPLREEDYPELYKALKEYNCYTRSEKDDIFIGLDDIEISPYENKILGWNYTEYRY